MRPRESSFWTLRQAQLRFNFLTEQKTYVRGPLTGSLCEAFMNPKKLDHALDHFLHESCRKRTKVEIFLGTGGRFLGRIVEYDQYSALLDSQGTQRLLYKKSSRFKVTRVPRNRQVKIGPQLSDSILPSS